MIDFDTFYREYKEDVRATNKKLDNVTTSVNDLCIRTTRIETKMQDASEAKTEKDKTLKDQTDKKYRRFTMVISAISAVSGFSFLWNLVHPK